MAATHTPRAADDKALRMMEMRDAGKNASEIARACGTTAGTVRRALSRIDADYAEIERSVSARVKGA